MLYNIMLTMFIWYADQERVLSNSMLDPFFWYKVPCYTTACWHGVSGKKSPPNKIPMLYITACWPNSSGIKSPVDRNPALYTGNSMLAEFWYKVTC